LLLRALNIANDPAFKMGQLSAARIHTEEKKDNNTPGGTRTRLFAG
jgi:hypothetical protein